jgi:hypothetical protein
MGLTPDEQAALEALTKKSQEPDDDEADEVWIQRPDGHTVGMSYKRGKNYLTSLGIDLSSIPVSDAGDNPPKTPARPKKGKAPDSDEGNGEGESPDLSFFQRRQQQRESAS